MQIVIDISDKIYGKIKEHYVKPYEVDEICEAILDGVQLSKGHGRLIDADEVLEYQYCVDGGDYCGDYYVVDVEDIWKVPTIIGEVKSNA